MLRFVFIASSVACVLLAAIALGIITYEHGRSAVGKTRSARSLMWMRWVAIILVFLGLVGLGLCSSNAEFVYGDTLVLVIALGVALAGILWHLRKLNRYFSQESSMDRIHSRFLEFTADPIHNIEQMTALCGEILHADCAIYNHAQDGQFTAWGQWQIPTGFDPLAMAPGQLFHEATKQNQRNTIVVRNLQQSQYAESDPNVSRYGLQTYIGFPVIFGQQVVGSLGVFYKTDYVPTSQDNASMSVIATAIGIEEMRKHAEGLLVIKSNLLKRLAEEHSLVPALAVSLEAALNSSMMDCGAIYLVDEASATLNIVHSYGLSDAFTRTVATYPLDSDRGWLVSSGNAVYSPDQSLLLPGLPAVEIEGLRALGIVPILHDGRFVGTMHVASHKQDSIPSISRIAVESIAMDIGSTITRLQGEADLQQRELEFATLFDTMEDMVFILESNGSIVRVNSAVIEKLGFTEDELIGQSMIAFHPDEYRENAQHTIEEMLVGRQTVCNIPLCAKDGTLIPVETKITLGLVGGRSLIVRISRDIGERMQAEKSLMQSEARYRILAETTGDIVWTIDLTGHFTYISRDIASMRRHAGSERIIQSYQDLLTPESAAVMANAIEEEVKCSLADREYMGARHLVLEIVRDDDSRTWIGTRLTVLRDENGNPSGVLGSSRDISDRKSLEDELKWKQGLLQAMANSSPLAFYVVDNRTGSVIYANHRFYEIWGLADIETRIAEGRMTNNEIIPFCLPHLSDVEAFAESCKPLQSEENRAIVEDEIPFIDGRTIRRFSTQIRDENDGYLGRFYLFEDITARKQAEATLEYRLQFENIIATLSTQFINCSLSSIDDEIRNAMGTIGSFVGADRGYLLRFDTDCTIMDNTHEWCAEGITPVIKSLQQLPTDTVPWLMKQVRAHETINIPRVDDLPSEADAEREILRSHDVQSVVLIPMHEAGDLLGYVGFDAVSREREWTGEAIRLLTMATDMLTNALSRKRTGEQLHVLQTELENRIVELHSVNRELEAFTYSVSHDLRAPLWHMTTFADALAQGAGELLPDDMCDLIVRIQRASERMSELIDALLALSRVSRGSFTPIDVSLTDIANEVAAALQRETPERTVAFSLAPDMQVTGDPRMLRIVVENLLGNAWKYTAKRELAVIDVGMLIQNGEKVYTIRDNGAGFNMAHADQLFVPFQRLHRDGEFPGTGIGLATVQRIILRHGGRIWAEGVVGHGATFYFTIGKYSDVNSSTSDPSTTVMESNI